MRRLLILMVVAIAVVACSPGSESEVVDFDQQTQLIVRATIQACGDLCVETPIYVRDQLLDANTLVGEETPMPLEVSDAITEAYPTVVFVDLEQADQLTGDLEGRRAVLVNIAPPTVVKPGVVGVDVGISYGGYEEQTILFSRDGSDWVITNGEDSGVTVTSSVS
ncbi:MAG: hypothetical protein WAN34_12660 [Acidimicrobiia bacterium]